MIKIERIETWGWEAAIRGMRNPLNSWEKSDSRFCDDAKWTSPMDVSVYSHNINHEEYVEIGGAFDPLAVTGFSIGKNDEKRMKTLIKGGPVECKFRRMIHVQMDITAPLYWWKEFDTYKVGTVANSCSTMHKIAGKKFEWEDFSTEHLDSFSRDLLLDIIDRLNLNREEFNNWSPNDLTAADKKHYWWQMIQLLPSSYNQKRTVDISYEVLANIYRHRKNHKLDEWRELCFNMSEILPYSWIFTEEFDGGAGWPQEKEPEYKKLLRKIVGLVNEGKIKREEVIDAVGFTFGLDLSQNGDSQTIMNLKSQELEANAQHATDLKGEKND